MLRALRSHFYEVKELAGVFGDRNPTVCTREETEEKGAGASPTKLSPVFRAHTAVRYMRTNL